MKEVKIIIPSAGRADHVLTNIENQILCVPDYEYSQYKEHNECEIITHPKLKNLAAKRNWIIEKFGDVFMCDDDLVSFERVYRSTDQILTPVESFKRIQELYYQAKFIDAKLFGFSEDPSPIHYNPYKPFMLKGYINGCAFGLLKDKNLFFTEKTTAAESHWINLLNTYHNRFNLIDTRFHFRQKKDSTFIGNGGQALKRTLESEKRDSLFLRSMFGEAVGLKVKKKDAKQNHQYQRRIISKW